MMQPYKKEEQPEGCPEKTLHALFHGHCSDILRCHEVHGLLSEKCILIQGNLLSDCNPDTIIEDVVYGLLSKENDVSRKNPWIMAKSFTLGFITLTVKEFLNRD